MKSIRIICAMLALFCLGSLVSCHTETVGLPEENPEKQPIPAADLAPLERLSVSGTGRLINESKKEVLLHGVNLGGWLLQETWMCPVAGSESNSESIRTLEERGFSEQQIRSLFQSYADHWITEKDLEYLASLGVNCVRVPFWYRNFMDEELRFYSENDAENPGFLLLDRLVAWAERYGIYVILDMHGCPGGQSTNHSCGIIGENRLYTEEKYSDAMERLWTRIAQHYRGCKTIAAYDIMNEPMNNDGSGENSWRAGSNTAIDYTLMIYDRMIRAIRAVDFEPIVTIEGVWSAYLLPDPKEYGWENVMYQLHLYDTSVESINYRIYELKTVRERYGVAAYVGEFNNGDVNQEHAYQAYLDADLSFTMWTYKVAKDHLGNWGLLSAVVPEADLKNDSYETLLEKWGENLESESFTVNPTVENWIKTYMKTLMKQ